MKMTRKREEKIIPINLIPYREHDCIWCMACVQVYPPQAIKVNQSNLEFHEKASGTFNEALSKSRSPPTACPLIYFLSKDGLSNLEIKPI